MELEGQVQTGERETGTQSEENRIHEMNPQVPERRVPAFQRSNSRIMDIPAKKNSLQTQLSIISEKSDRDFLLGEEDSDPFDVDEIIRHLSSFSSDEREIVTELDVVDTIKKAKENEEMEAAAKALKHTNSGEWRRISDVSGIRPNRRRKSRISLPNISLDNLTSLLEGRRQSSSASSIKFDQMPEDWKLVFNSLDRKDGHKDGRLHKRSLQNMLNTLETNSTWSLDYKTDQLGERIKRQISKADKDKNGYLDKEEFADLVERLQQASETCQVDMTDATDRLPQVMTGHIKTAAYAGECRLCPPPLFLIFVSFFQIGFFVHQVLKLAGEGEIMHWDGPAPLCSPLIYNPSRRWEAWRYLSYSMVHSGYSHVVLNVVMQLAVGLPLECSQGTIRTALVYIMGVLAGSLSTACLDPHVYLAGASGGVYSLILAHLSTLILNWKEDVLIVRPKVWKKRGQKDKTAKATHGTLIRMLKLTAVLAFTLVDTGMAVYNKHMYADNNTVGYTAHIAGAVAGLVVGFFALENRRVQSWEEKLKVVSFLLTLVLLGSGVFWVVFGDDWYGLIHPGEKYFLLPSSVACPPDELFFTLP